MATVEDRIVSIRFDNAQFEQKIQGTLASLASLDKALQFQNVGQGMSGITNAAKQVDLSGISAGVDNISSKFGLMGAVGFTAIQSLTQAAMGFFSSVASKIVDPVFQGGMTRALAIEQAQFMFRGLGVDVDAAMASAKAAVLGTAYGLGDAAKAAAQFAASGIQVGDQMTGALRGVAGAAAMTGTSFGEIAYIFSGIAGSNKVNSQDLMQFSTRGLNAAAAIAKATGTTEQAVRDMVSNGQMDFATFADAMDKAFGAHATQANETYTGSLANLHAAMSRLGAALISPQLTHLRDIFNTLTPTIDSFTAAIKPAIDAFSIISGWVTSGLVGLIKGISFDGLKASMPLVTNGMLLIYTALKNIWNIGKNVLQEMFPPSSVSFIQEIATGFLIFADWIQITVERMWAIRGVFQTVFAALSIGWTVVKEGAIFFGNLAKSIMGIFGPGVSSFMEKLGNTMAGLQDSLVKGGGIKSFFDGLTESLKKPIEWLQKVHDAIANVFSGWRQDAADSLGSAADGVGDKFSSMKDRLASVWDPFLNAVEKVWGAIEKVGTGIGNWLKGLWQQLAAAISTEDFNNILDALNTALLGGIAALMARFLKGGFNFNFIPGIANLGNNLQNLTNTLNVMQGKLKAEALMKIAEAIGLLAVSMLILSTIPSEALTKALTAMSVGFAQLLGSFALLGKMSTGPKGALDFGMIATGLVVLAGAMILLSIAVKILSSMDWNELAKGLTGTLALLGGISLAVKPLSANSSGMISAGIGIGAIATAMVILAIAMKIMASMNWEELAKGLIGVSVGLGAIILAMRLLPNDLAMVKAGIGIMAIATATAILGGAVAIFASMNWESLGKGLLGMVVSLGAVVLAVNLMPKDMGSSAASILLVSIALIALSGAIGMLGGMSWENMAKGLVGIAVALGLLVGASMLMEGAIPGAGAMVLVAGAMLILAKAIVTIGKLSVGELVTGLVGLAVGIGIIAAASMLLSAAVPEILALGVALTFLGAGLALIGLAALLFAKALELIGSATQSALLNLPKVLEAIGSAIPMFLKGIAEGIVQMIEVFTKAAPAIMKSLGVFLSYLLDTLIKVTPKILVWLGMLMQGFIDGVKKYSPQLIDAGIQVIMDFLQGISDNIEAIVTLVADIITKFLDAMANETPRVVDSLVNLFTTFFLETARGLGEVAGTLLLGIGQAFIEGFLDGATNQLNGPVWGFILSIPGTILGWIGDALSWLWQTGVDIITSMWNGLVAGVTAVWNFFTGIPGQILGFFVGAIGWLVEAGSDILTGLKNGIEKIGESAINWLSNIHNKVWGVFEGAWDWLTSIGEDIMQGLWNGMKDIWDKVTGWLPSLNPADYFNDINLEKGHAATNLLPTGKAVMAGLRSGMQDGWTDVTVWLQTLNPADSIQDGFATSLSKTIGDVAASLNDYPEFQPTITPVVDLTNVQAAAGQIADYIPDTASLTAHKSFKNAKHISKTHKDKIKTLTDANQTGLNGTNGGVIFQQTINSPTRLSSSEIYKNTRNQITMAKEELSIP